MRDEQQPTEQQPTDRQIHELLERRANRARTSGLLSEIVREARQTPQRRGGPRVPLLLSAWSMPALGGLAAALALVAVVVLAIGPLLGPARPAPIETKPVSLATPTAAPSPTAGIQTITAPDIFGPLLAAGTWQTATFEPRLRFTVPGDRWAAGLDLPRQLLLRAYFAGGSDEEFDVVTLMTIQNVYVEPCTNGTAQNVPWEQALGPAGFLDWLEAEMEFDLGPRTATTVLGIDALEVEFNGPDLSRCVLGYMPITDNGRSAPFGSPPTGQDVRYQMIQLQGQTVIVATWTDDPARRDMVWAAADAVLESITLAP